MVNRCKRKVQVRLYGMFKNTINQNIKIASIQCDEIGFSFNKTGQVRVGITHGSAWKKICLVPVNKPMNQLDTPYVNLGQRNETLCVSEQQVPEIRLIFESGKFSAEIKSHYRKVFNFSMYDPGFILWLRFSCYLN